VRPAGAGRPTAGDAGLGGWRRVSPAGSRADGGPLTALLPQFANCGRRVRKGPGARARGASPETGPAGLTGMRDV